MRSSSTVSAPLQQCTSPLTAHHSRYLAVQLLTGQTLYFLAESKSKAKEVYAETCLYLSEQGMIDTDLFGLATVCDGEYIFVDPESKLSKYAPKNWKSSSTHGLDGQGNPLLVLHFRVQFYVDNSRLLRDKITRHHYYLQLRDNVVVRGQMSVCFSDELLLLLAGYALQADLGDISEEMLPTGYPFVERYLPQNLLSRNTHCATTITALHRGNRGLSEADAELHYIREASASTLDSASLSLNLHLYRLHSQKKRDDSSPPVWLAICAKGISIIEETKMHGKNVAAGFCWNNIGKLCFDRKKFEIRALNSAGEKLTYYTSSDEKSKHLLMLCRLTHQFSMSVQSRLSDVRRKDDEVKKRLKDSSKRLSQLRLSSGGYKVEQRISVISSTSSNATSGIVSDRVQSLDGSEDDLVLDPIVGSPPGDSVESLALAHLCDGSSSDVQDASSQGEDMPDCALPPHPKPLKSSPLVGTPATTDGSQCSSSCSTVVVAGVHGTAPTLSVRRGSTTSSLELGYSHTAQNSMLSEIDLEIVQPKIDVEDTESKKTVSDLESGVYTTSTRDTTQRTDNSSSGIYTLDEGDDEDGGIRPRLGSNASFHGDGSDPSEAGKGSLLTAEELSDLIVGSYPCRATVSHTLDSDSDYVTLPPPPRPPPRSEASARFVTTKPHISMITHSNVSLTALPNYATMHDPPPPPVPQRTYFPDPGAKMKPNANMPVVGRNNYLDVHASRVNNRLALGRPPPPPVPSMATVYTSQVTRSQIEQFKQQLYSDVDYVIYPMKDPAISKQEYMDAKLAARYVYPPPPPYPSPKTHVVYRSAPNVAYLPLNFSSQPEHLYGYYGTYLPQPSHYSSTSPLYSSSSGSLSFYDPLPQIPGTSLNFSRARSDENLLQEKPRFRRFPPPPPPPYKDYCTPSLASSKTTKIAKEDKIVDIHTLREKSRNLDLPLISALCNDKSLIRQTNAFVMPKHPAKGEPVAETKQSLLESIFSGKTSKRYASSSKLKYPVSGLSTTQISKPHSWKMSSTHVHPNKSASAISASSNQTIVP